MRHFLLVVFISHRRKTEDCISHSNNLISTVSLCSCLKLLVAIGEVDYWPKALISAHELCCQTNTAVHLTRFSSGFINIFLYINQLSFINHFLPGRFLNLNNNLQMTTSYSLYTAVKIFVVIAVNIVRNAAAWRYQCCQDITCDDSKTVGCNAPCQVRLHYL